MNGATLTICLALSAPAFAQVRYVDADAPGDNTGQSWEHAYLDLQDALRERFDRTTEIRVAEGTYRPDRGSLDRDASFEIRASAAIATIRGGFAGYGAPDPDERDSRRFKTILSGDLLNDDDGFKNASDNSYHVVHTESLLFKDESRVVLDGVVVQGGNANFDEYDRGGGILALWGGLTLTDCVLTGNQATYGGGALVTFGAGLLVDRCTFINNKSGGRGGAILAGSGNTPVGVRLFNTAFVANHAATDGGAVYLRYVADDILVIVSSTFAYNSAGMRGGAVAARLRIPTQPVLFNSIFWDNSDEHGGEGWESQIGLIGQAWLIAEHCCIKGGYPWNEFGTAENPDFLDPLGDDGLPGTGDEDLRVAEESPCIDSGINAPDHRYVGDLNTMRDLDGNLRVANVLSTMNSGNGVCTVTDIGAYEKIGDQCCNVWHDLPAISDCLHGPNAIPRSEGPFNVFECVLAFDTDDDKDIDLRDFANLTAADESCP